MITDKTLPIVYEHILARYYGWTLDYIKSLNTEEIKLHTHMCLMVRQIEMEQAMTNSISTIMSSGKSRGKKTKTVNKKFDPQTGQFEE